jgi:lipopolysaccharide/colanic/teichoic acid biosynthesis glycosyltransferase
VSGVRQPPHVSRFTRTPTADRRNAGVPARLLPDGSGQAPSPASLSLEVAASGELALQSPARAGALEQALTPSRRAAIDAALKRALDVAVSLTVLLVLVPLLALVAIMVKLESPGPVLYRCRRPGLGGRDIDVLKFRKMRDGCGGGALTVGKDERFTRLGNLLASTRIDELPQLWNVLRGDMSVVGPRPEDPSFVALRRREFDDILQVRPGITGLSQLAFAREREVLAEGDPTTHYVTRILPQKLRLDTFYAVERTLAMDLRIALWTLVAVVLRKDVSVDRSTGRLALRRRSYEAAADS